MDLEIKRTGVGRTEIDRILGRLSHSELRRCRQIVEAALEGGARGDPSSGALPLLRESKASHAVMLVGFFINRSYRVWISASLVESLGGLRDLAWLRGRLTALSLSRADPPALAASEATQGEQGSGKDPAGGAIALAYRLCVGREPEVSEVLAWESGCGNSIEFARAFCDLHDGAESREYRKRQWALFASGGEVKDGERDDLRGGVVYGYRLTVGRTPGPSEVEIWMTNFRNGLAFGEYLRLMNGSLEAAEYRKRELSDLSDGRFIQLVYESVLGYGIGARQLSRWERELAIGRIDRTGLLTSAFKTHAAALEPESGLPVQLAHDALRCSIACTGKVLTPELWSRRAEELRNEERPVPASDAGARFHILRKPGPLISAIASLYRGGDFIEQFMDNLTTQSCFRDYCELIIVDADSPENESEVIERYCRQHANIVYRRMNYRIGVYDAWNVGVKLARGEYLTNTNLDDLRRRDSLELQAGVLENLPFVDVAYQDFYYTFDPRLSFEEIARFGFRSNVPVVSPHNMMEFNSPHNAPMWRKRLHDELGLFDTSFRSAGDYEFWMRCLVAGKVFYKLNEPHVAYYQNPMGLSTRPDTRGVEESWRIFKTYARQLVSDSVVMPIEEFAKRCLPGVQDIPTPEASRYALCQKALRELAMTRKYAHKPGGGGR